MKLKQLFYSITFLFVACENSDSAFSPQALSGAKTYLKEVFERIEVKQLANERNTIKLHKDIVGVFPSDEGIVFKERIVQYDSFNLKVKNGFYECANYGEWGGFLKFIPSDSHQDTIEIFKPHINFIFHFNDNDYILQGGRHIGMISKISKIGNNITCDSILAFGTFPSAMTIYKDRIIIAGPEGFCVIRDLNLEFEIPNQLLDFDPNSIVAIDANNIYVGMKGGYARFSLITKSVNYFKLWTKDDIQKHIIRHGENEY